MKNNWGTYIAITYTIFAASMIFMLLRSCSKENPLIEENYYEKELGLENTKKHIKNTHLQQVEPVMSEEGSQIIWAFKNTEQVNGIIQYKNLSSPQYDYSQPFDTHNGTTISIDKSKINHGDYQVEIKWQDTKDTFYYKELIML